MKRFPRVFAVSSLIMSILANAQVEATTTNVTLAQATQQETPAFERTIEQQGWKFELQNCQRVKETVSCNFLITNVGYPERHIQLYGNHNYSDVSKVQIIDYSGNQYVVKSLRFGNIQHQSEIQQRLIQGVAVAASISIELPQQVNKLAMFEIVYRNGRAFWDMDSRIGSAKFRDLEIVTAKASASTRKIPNRTRKK